MEQQEGYCNSWNRRTILKKKKNQVIYMLPLSGFRKEGREMQFVLIWNVELPVAFLARCVQSTGMVLSFFCLGGLSPYYAPIIAILNSKGRFDQKTTTFKANVPNMNFFFVKSQMKNLKKRECYIFQLHITL